MCPKNEISVKGREVATDAVLHTPPSFSCDEVLG